MSLTVHPKDIVEASESPLLASAEHWERKPLGEVATIMNGYAFASKMFSRTEGFPLIRIRDISNGTTTERFKGQFEERYLIRSGDLLVGMDGDFNVARWSGPPALLNQRVMKIEPKATILDIDFLTHLLPGYLQAIHDLTSSTTVKHLSSRDVERLPIPVPAIEEQQRIATQISALLELVRSSSDRLAAIPALLKKFRQSVLADACSGQLTADWRDSQLEVETDDLGSIPETWKVQPFHSVIRELRNGVSPRPSMTPPGVPVLRISSTRAMSVDLDEVRYLPQGERFLTQFGLLDGDLLFTRYNGSLELLGVCGMVRGLGGRALLYPDKLMRVRLKEGITDPRFVEIFFSGPGARERMTLTSRSTAGQQGVSGKDVKEQPVVLPPLPEQAEIVRRVESLFALADSIESRLADATAQVERTTQAILAKAFRGELTSEVAS